MGSVEQVHFDAGKALASYGVDVNAFSKHEKPVKAAFTSLFPDQIVADHDAWNDAFWSTFQRAAKPVLIFQPKSTKDVAIALLLCRWANCKFAVKSGGHAAMKGASSVDGGVTFDMKNINDVTLNEDKSIATIGTGNKWEYVYEVLAKDGVAVAGGRAGDVGVGGYSLGGGISFFASTRGWGCDTIRKYELITAEGKILNVTYESYPDLFWALRGGGTNFGIVTRFDYETFPQGDIFAGSNIIDAEHKNAAIKVFDSHAHNADVKAATWFGIAVSQGRKLLVGLAMYSEPNPDAAFIKPWAAIPAIHSTSAVRSMADMAHEVAVGVVKDHRNNYSNHTFKYDADFVSWLADMFWEEAAPFAANLASKQGCVLMLQVYTKESIALMRRNGGNCLPLREDEAPYLNVLLPSAWERAEDDDQVYAFIDRIMGLVVAEGKRRGLYVDFMYMNYSGERQDVLKGYGEENYNKLKVIAEKYDPQGVFQTLMPGYFKFGGPIV